MTIFKVSLRMAHDTTWLNRRKWSNSFYVDTIDPTTAAGSVATGWVSYLRSAAATTVFAYEVYATDLNSTSENYATVPIAVGQQRGTQDLPPDGEAYLPKACLAVELLVPNSRPSRKFWRPGLYEGWVGSGVAVNGALDTAIRTAFAGFVADFEGTMMDVDGQVISGVGKITLTTREFGRTAGNNLPLPPAVG